MSQVNDVLTQYTGLTGKTYISELQKKLDEERQAREKLQSELEELKKFSGEMAIQLNDIQKSKIDI